MEKSTRLSIVEHALADAIDRLDGLPVTQDAERLRTLALQYQIELDRWRAQPPNDAERESLLKAVLDLDVALIRAGAAPSDRPDDDDDDDYPKPL